MILILVVLCSCEEEDPVLESEEAVEEIEEPEDVPLDPMEIAGTYGTVRFYTDYEYLAGEGFNFKIEPISGDTVLLRGDFSFCADSLMAHLQGDSIVIPLQSFPWTNQSPGGASWIEYSAYEGLGQYDRDKHRIRLRFKNFGDQNWIIDGVKEEFLDLTGSYKPNGTMSEMANRMPPSLDDRLEITLSPTKDSLQVSFICDYQDHVDSALQKFKMPYDGCLNEYSFEVDSANSLYIVISGNSEYANLRIGRYGMFPLEYSPEPVYITNYYRFSGNKIVQN